MNETKSLCNVRNSPKTAVSTEPASVTSAPERTRGKRAGQQPTALLGTAGVYPPALSKERATACIGAGVRTDVGQAATHGGGIQWGRESRKILKNTLPGSCCKVLPFPLPAPLAEGPFPPRLLALPPPVFPVYLLGQHTSLSARHILSPQPQASTPCQRNRGQAHVQGITGFLWDALRSRPRIGVPRPFLQEQQLPMLGAAKTVGALSPACSTAASRC